MYALALSTAARICWVVGLGSSAARVDVAKRQAAMSAKTQRRIICSAPHSAQKRQKRRARQVSPLRSLEATESQLPRQRYSSRGVVSSRIAPASTFTPLIVTEPFAAEPALPC